MIKISRISTAFFSHFLIKLKLSTIFSLTSCYYTLPTLLGATKTNIIKSEWLVMGTDTLMNMLQTKSNYNVGTVIDKFCAIQYPERLKINWGYKTSSLSKITKKVKLMWLQNFNRVVMTWHLIILHLNSSPCLSERIIIPG